MRSHLIMENGRYEQISQLLTKFSQEGHNNYITFEDQDLIFNTSRLLVEDIDSITYFFNKIRDIYSSEIFPQHSIIPGIIGNIVRNSQNNDILLEKIREFVWTLLEEDINHLVILGFQIFRENRRLFGSQIMQYAEKIIEYWSNEDVDLQCLSLYTIEGITHSNYRYLMERLDTIIDFIINSSNDCSKSYSMKILGDIYLNANRASISIEMNEELIDSFLVSYLDIEEPGFKRLFLEGFEWLMYEYSSYKSDWLDILLNEYRVIDNIPFKSQLLRVLSGLPNKKELDEVDSHKYIDFFNGELSNLIENDYELPQNSIIYQPNLLQDVLSNIQQLSFRSPLIIEQLLPKYEEVFCKYVPNLVDNRPGFFGMAWQRLHSIYFNLINFFKTENELEKLSIYYQRAAELAFSEKEGSELNINHLQHKITVNLNNQEIEEVKGNFNLLQHAFIEFNENFDEIHPCVPIWTLLEDLTHLSECSITNFDREIRRLNEHFSQFQIEIPDDLSEIIRNFELSRGSYIQLTTTENLSRCQTLFNDCLNKLSEIASRTIEMDAPLITNIIDRLVWFEEDSLRDIATQRNIQFSVEARRRRGYSEYSGEDEELQLWKEVINFLKNLSLKKLFPDHLPDENVINRRLFELLEGQFDNVFLEKIIMERVHIDLEVDSKIAIEVKKIRTNTKKDELVGQIIEDIRIAEYPYGILFGIDCTPTKKFRGYNEHYFGVDRNMVYIIKIY